MLIASFNNSIVNNNFATSRKKIFLNLYISIYLSKYLYILGIKQLENNGYTNLWPFSKSKFNLKSNRVNLVAPASPIECLLYLPIDTVHKPGPERLIWLKNSNVLRLPVDKSEISWWFTEATIVNGTRHIKHRSVIF